MSMLAFLVAALCCLVGTSQAQAVGHLAEVAVILPTYARPGLLRFALTQLSQTKQRNIEVIVVDDSPQESVGDLKKLLRNDQTLAYFHSPDRLAIGAKSGSGSLHGSCSDSSGR